MATALAALQLAAALLLAVQAALMLWLSRPMAWDVRVPTALFWLLPLALLALAAWLARRGVRTRRASRLPPLRSALAAAASALLVAWAVSGLRAIEKYYFEPDGEVPLAHFDASGWSRFDTAAWEARAPVVRARLARAWGDLPQRVPLAPRVVSTVQEEGYARLEVEIAAEASGRPAWDVASLYLLLPDEPRARPAPAVIVHHQHADRFEKGKEEPAGLRGDPRQALGVELVRRGWAVAAPDALGFGARREHGEAWTATALLLRGRTLGAKYAWDVSRVVDYLETRPEVDASRIAIAGHSLGGQMAVFAAVFDPRLRAVVSSCGFSRLAGERSQLSTGHIYAYATYLPGLLAGERPVEMREIVGLLRGRPLFLASGLRDDIFPIEGVAEIHAWLEQLYAHDGIPERLVTLRHRGAHMFPQAAREAAWEFLARAWPEATDGGAGD